MFVSVPRLFTMELHFLLLVNHLRAVEEKANNNRNRICEDPSTFYFIVLVLVAVVSLGISLSLLIFIIDDTNNTATMAVHHFPSVFPLLFIIFCIFSFGFRFLFAISKWRMSPSCWVPFSLLLAPTFCPTPTFATFSQLYVVVQLFPIFPPAFPRPDFPAAPACCLHGSLVA